MSSKRPKDDEHSSLPNYNSRWVIPPPEPIDTTKINSDGGTFLQLDNGRIIEYFVCGSTSNNDSSTTVLVDCHGGNFTGQAFGTFPTWVEQCQRLKWKVISLSVPGMGYSTIQPERIIRDWPKTDLLPVLRREKVQKFIVTGISFGCPHAMATAVMFAKQKEHQEGGKDDNNDNEYGGIECIGMGLRVPYMGSETCTSLNLKNHISLGYTSRSANTSMWSHYYARLITSFSSQPSKAFEPTGCLVTMFIECLNPGANQNLKRLMTDHPNLIPILKVAMDRSVIHTTQGILYNYTNETLIHHGFDVTDIPKTLPLLVWYATDDEDCPPSHGEWLTSNAHFQNVTKRILSEYGHIGGAFIDHPAFLEELANIFK